MNALRFLLGSLIGFGALNAFGGGIYGMAGAKEVPLAWLEGSPFSSYFIPSLILFAIVGGAFLVASVAVFMNRRSGPLLALLSGCIALVWINVQLLIIGSVSWMQPATVLFSIVVMFLAAIWTPVGRGVSTHTSGRLRRVALSKAH